MSQRETILLKALGILALCAGLLIGFKNFYEPKYRETKNTLQQAELEIESTKMFLANADLFADEQDWITQHQPEPATQQASQSDLQAVCEKNATNAQLEIIKQTPLSSAQEEGAFYHRARMEMLVKGSEANFYNWLSSLDDPLSFRRVTKLRMNPLRDDDTQIEAQAVIEQWYVPENNNEL